MFVGGHQEPIRDVGGTLELWSCIWCRSSESFLCCCSKNGHDTRTSLKTRIIVGDDNDCNLVGKKRDVARRNIDVGEEGERGNNMMLKIAASTKRCCEFLSTLVRSPSMFDPASAGLPPWPHPHQHQPADCRHHLSPRCQRSENEVSPRWEEPLSRPAVNLINLRRAFITPSPSKQPLNMPVKS